MVRLFCLCVVLTLLYGCVSAKPSSTIVPTSAPAQISTDTPAVSPLPLATSTDTETPTAQASPTLAVPYFYSGLAPSLDLFSPVNKADIPSIIGQLAALPSLLDNGSGAVDVARIAHDPATGEAVFSIACNYGIKINCIPAASIKIADQGIDAYVLIWEIRNKDGSRGYFAEYIYDPVQQTRDYDFNQLVVNPRGSQTIMFHTSLSKPTTALYPYSVSLTQQPGYQEAVQAWIDTGIVPTAFRQLILPW